MPRKNKNQNSKPQTTRDDKGWNHWWLKHKAEEKHRRDSMIVTNLGDQFSHILQSVEPSPKTSYRVE